MDDLPDPECAVMKVSARASRPFRPDTPGLPINRTLREAWDMAGARQTAVAMSYETLQLLLECDGVQGRIRNEGC